jgi:hypothetical protein
LAKTYGTDAGQGFERDRHAHVRIEAAADPAVATVTGLARREGHPRHEQFGERSGVQLYESSKKAIPPNGP